MAKATSSKASGTGKSAGAKGSNKSTMDKIAKAAMSREMLAAGLTAAAAAIAASPKARRAIRDAGLDAADTASTAATQMMGSASKLGSLIAEAVADAAQRVLSGKWVDSAEEAVAKAADSAKKAVGLKTTPAKRKPAAKKAGARKTATRKAAAPKAAAKTAATPRATTAKPRSPAKPRTSTRRKPAAKRATKPKA